MSGEKLWKRPRLTKGCIASEEQKNRLEDERKMHKR
jgi:hypothetical protein